MSTIVARGSDTDTGGGTDILVRLLESQFSGRPFAESFAQETRRLRAIVAKHSDEAYAVDNSPLLSGHGKLVERERITATAAREIREWAAAQSRGIAAHIASVTDAAKRQATTAKPQDSTLMLLDYFQTRDCLEELLLLPGAEMAVMLEHMDVDDPSLRVIDHPPFAAKLARHIGGVHFVEKARAARDARRDARLAPDTVWLRELQQSYETIASTALNEIGARAAGFDPSRHERAD